LAGLVESVLHDPDWDPNLPVAFLTSSNDECRPSVLVLSTTPTDQLPKVPVEWPPKSGTFEEINYRSGHSMFTRALLLEATYYEPGNRRLADLPGILNCPNCGFDAKFHTPCPDMLDAELYYFFPAAVQPTARVMGYGSELTFSQLIPAEKLGRLYDDRNSDAAFLAEPDHRGAYVLLDGGHAQAFVDRSPESPAILRRQFMRPSSGVHVLEVARALLLDESRGAQNVTVRRDRIHVPLGAIVSLVIDQLKRQDPKLQFHADVHGDAKRWQPLGRAIWALNGRRPTDVHEQALLARWASGLKLAHVVQVLSEAREAVARDLKISLEGDPDPVFDPPLGDTLA
jgi:hypothetical protein